MSPIRHNINTGGADNNVNLMDSPHHVNIMKKISELQLTVDSLRKERKDDDDGGSDKNKEILSKSAAHLNPKNDEVNISEFIFLYFYTNLRTFRVILLA